MCAGVVGGCVCLWVHLAASGQFLEAIREFNTRAFRLFKGFTELIFLQTKPIRVTSTKIQSPKSWQNVLLGPVSTACQQHHQLLCLLMCPACECSDSATYGLSLPHSRSRLLPQPLPELGLSQLRNLNA